MEQNKPFAFLIAVICFFSVQMLCAQEAGYYIDYSGEKPRIIQKIVWDNDEYAMRYDVEIQQYHARGTAHHEAETSGGSGERLLGFYEYEKKTTTDFFLDVILPPGKFRYNITPFDYLGRPGESSGWIEFEIITAYHSVIDEFTPETFFLDKRHERELIICGTNLSDESNIFLSNAELDLFPESMDFLDSNRVLLYFDDETLPVGKYDIHIINPGGIESIKGVFKVGYSKPLDVFIKTAYTPIFPIYGELDKFFPESFYITGINFALELISSKRSALNGGVELSYTGYMLNPAFSFKTDLSDAWDGWMNISDGIALHDFDLNIALQKRFFKRRMAVTFRFGGGFTVMNGSGIYQQNNFISHFNLGLSYMILLFDIFHLEIGADFGHYNSENSSGIIKPKLSLVWKF